MDNQVKLKLERPIVRLFSEANRKQSVAVDWTEIFDDIDVNAAFNNFITPI
jgi:hypothetical protein